MALRTAIERSFAKANARIRGAQFTVGAGRVVERGAERAKDG